MASVFGKNIIVSIFGESHGSHIGAVVDGLPCGIEINMAYINNFIDKRKAKHNVFSTSRIESDEIKIISGVTNNITNGAPFTFIIENKNKRSSDYNELSNVLRPSHADFTSYIKYHGYNDRRGGGHFSGRLTAPICVVGAICKEFLEKKGIKIGAHIFSIGDVCDTSFLYNKELSNTIDKLSTKEFAVISDEKGEKMKELVKEIRSEGDSIGGIVECACIGLPIGIGSPHFDGIENRLSSAIFGVPAIKGIEFGSGFAGTKLRGSENNDSFYMDGDNIITRTNNCGGILGGISNGMPIIFRVAVKPTTSISKEQDTVDIKNKTNVKISINGRHDSCIVPRVLPCIEAITSIVLLDMMEDK